MPPKQTNRVPAIKRYIIPLLFLCCPFKNWCQVTTNNTQNIIADSTPATTAGNIHKAGLFVINGIFISGNKKTKYNTIVRELPFKKGDSIYLPQLVASFQRSKELLINTRLFNDVIVSLKNFNGYGVDVQIDVKERWYIFPIPYFRPVDRNLSAWADKNYSLSRVNYGIKFLHSNFSGRNDRLRIWLLTGYTRQVQLNYDQPASDKSLKHGFGFGVFYAALKEINVSTNNNAQTFINADTLTTTNKYLLKQSTATLSYFYRPALTTRHVVRLGFNYIQTDSAVSRINPKFFNNGVQKVFYPELSYTLEYQKVDYVGYVLKGFMGDVNFTHRGINSSMDLNQFTGRFTNGWALGRKYYFGLQGYGAVKLPLEQPYFNQRLFGYGDIYLRGLEKYVVDGVAGMMLRSTFRKHLFSFSMSGGGLPTLPRVPFAIYAKIYGDMGYAYNKTFLQNALVNQMLYTTGAGIDVVSSYDFVFRAEYSFNQLGQSGFFFHIRNDF
ncbi:MAG: POTRA domain-containing protein [Bacteroidota bacterium]